jgi:signal peptidase I
MIAQNIIQNTVKKSTKALLWGVLGVTLALSALKVTHYLFPTYKVNGISMMPSIAHGEVYGTVTFWGSVKRHDVFMINPDYIEEPGIKHPGGPYMKRIVGLPGDTLTFSKKDGSLLHINGLEINLSRAPEYTGYKMRSKLPKSKGATITNHAYQLTMGDVSYPIYRADNSEFASDFKLKSYTDVVFNFPWLSKQKHSGETVSVTVPKDHYFSLSDNRPAGTDSRHFGFVPKRALQQKTLVKR